MPAIAHTAQLTSKPLGGLLERGRSIDYRLSEPPWNFLRVGDHIKFWEDFTGHDTAPNDGAREVVVRIKEIFTAPDFETLLIELEGRALAKRSKRQGKIAELRSRWGEGLEIVYGVLAFRVVRAK